MLHRATHAFGVAEGFAFAIIEAGRTLPRRCVRLAGRERLSVSDKATYLPLDSRPELFVPGWTSVSSISHAAASVMALVSPRRHAVNP